MNETSAGTTESTAEPVPPIAASRPEHEDHLQHVGSSLLHAVGKVADKVTDAFANIVGRR